MKSIWWTALICGSLFAFTTLAEAAAIPDNMSNAESPVKAKAADRSLQKNVRRALSKTKGLSVANVLVRANNGVITLQGTVPESAQIDVAGRVAQAVPNVTSVTNRLTVRANGP